MRIVVAGAAGAIGRQLVPRLVEAGHAIWGMTRSESKRADIEEMGVRAVVVDALRADEVAGAVAQARAEVIIHELTAIGSLDIRNFDRSFAPTNRLRTEGTDHLLAAGRAVGVKRFIAQSYAGWPYARIGGRVKTEGIRWTRRPHARCARRSTRSFISRQLSPARTGRRGSCCATAGSMVLAPRMCPGGEQWEQVRKRKFPVVGDGAGIWSFVHIADAADGDRDRGRPRPARDLQHRR